MPELRNYQGVMLCQNDYEVLSELESVLKQPLLPLNEVNRFQIGFGVDSNFVTTLDFEKSFVVSIPESICKLQHLQKIFIPEILNFVIPSCVFTLPSLDYISTLEALIPEDIRQGFYGGARLEAEEIGVLRQLETLVGGEFYWTSCWVDSFQRHFKSWGRHVRHLSLRGLSTPSLPSLLQSFKYLEQIYLFEGRLDSLSPILKEFKYLTKIWFPDNEISELPEWIGECISLRELSLAENKLVRIPETIGNLKELRRLILGANKLSELPESVGNLQYLEELDIMQNTFKSLPETITRLRSLKILMIGLQDPKRHNPYLVLTPNQLEWIHELRQKGCKIR